MKERNVYFVFMAFGLVFFSVGMGFFLHSMNVQAIPYQVQGEVIENIYVKDGMTKPRIRYEHQGLEHFYVSSVSSKPPQFSVGDTVTVYLKDNDPKQAYVVSGVTTWVFPLAFGGFGAVFFGLGFFMYRKWRQRKRNQQWAKRHGAVYYLKVASVDRNTRIKINGRSPWVVTCQWQDPNTQKLHILQSDNIWFNPESYLSTETDVEVRLDPNNPSRYWINLAVLLPQVA